MEVQRRYGYVDIDSPLVGVGRSAGPSDEMPLQVEGWPQVDPWPAMAYERGSFTPVHFLMIAVLLISGLAVWLSLQPGHIASASGPQLPSESGIERSEGLGSVGGDSSSRVAEGGSMEYSEGADLPAVEGVGALSPLFSPEVHYWEPQILRWASEHSVDPNIVATIMQIESCGNPEAASYAGAQGLFQVMPFHFLPGEDMLDPDINAMRGLAFFREQMRYTGGDVFLSFAGYNGGYAASGGAFENWAAETQRYYYWAKGIYLDASSGAVHSDRLDEWLAAGGGGGCQIAAEMLGI